jgi:prophage maintenance system killer protein
MKASLVYWHKNLSTTMVNIAAILLLLLGSTVHAFVPAQQRSAATTTVQPLRASLPNPEESARVLTEYMAKAHEEKVEGCQSC